MNGYEKQTNTNIMKEKYRIRVVTDSNGKKLYYPQYRFLFRWFNYFDYYGSAEYFLDLNKAKNYIEYKKEAKVEIIEL